MGKMFTKNILKLKQKGKSRKEIAAILGCNVCTVSYHSSPNGLKKAALRHKKFRSQNPVSTKITNFFRKKTNNIQKFTEQELLQKIGKYPSCYLTGQKIDLNNTTSYSLDHIIPLSRGGESTLDNCDICISEVNLMKWNLLNEELFEFCKKVLRHQGFLVTSVKDIMVDYCI